MVTSSCDKKRKYFKTNLNNSRHSKMVVCKPETVDDIQVVPAATDTAYYYYETHITNKVDSGE